VAQEFQFGHVSGPVQIGNGQQYVAGRDQYAAGRDQHLAGDSRVVSDAVDRLRQEIAGLGLATRDELALEDILDDIEIQAAQRRPDASSLGQRLETLTRGLKQAGALTSSASSVVESISAIAKWLGPTGAAVLALL
jgi:hypothetical protein